MGSTKPNTITLPDHITFEELAAKWCEYYDDNFGSNVMAYDGDKWEFIYPKHRILLTSFTLDMRTRILQEDVYHDDNKRRDLILDYIKERSNG